MFYCLRALWLNPSIHFGAIGISNRQKFGSNVYWHMYLYGIWNLQENELYWGVVLPSLEISIVDKYIFTLQTSKVLHLYIYYIHIYTKLKQHCESSVLLAFTFKTFLVFENQFNSKVSSYFRIDHPRNYRKNFGNNFGHF